MHMRNPVGMLSSVASSNPLERKVTTILDKPSMLDTHRCIVTKDVDVSWLHMHVYMQACTCYFTYVYYIVYIVYSCNLTITHWFSVSSLFTLPICICKDRLKTFHAC